MGSGIPAEHHVTFDESSTVPNFELFNDKKILHKHSRSKDLKRDFMQANVNPLLKGEKLYLDHENFQGKLDTIRSREELEMKRLHNNKHTNKKSAFM